MYGVTALPKYLPKCRNAALHSGRGVHTVVMVRHGESLWNVEKRFTGWCDVPLTKNGELDARDAGALIGSRGIKFDIAFTSYLERAWRSCGILLSEAGQSDVETIRSWRLNERHYGLLQGHRKDSPDLKKEFGEEKLLEWRQSYHECPPSLFDSSVINALSEKVLNVSREFGSNFGEPGIPDTESLKRCERRAFGYWNDVIAPRVKEGQNVLIVAHANTIRTLVKAIDDIPDELISKLKIPNGIPLVYTLDENLRPIDNIKSTDDVGVHAKYLVSARNHGKMMEYERCVRKKLRAIFEFLDVDGDGKITPDCLATGLLQLNGEPSNTAEGFKICEFEVEELLRCIPTADESGVVNLKEFLDSEQNLLPVLSRLSLLQ